MRTLYPATADRWQAPWLVGANDSCRPRCEEHEPKNAKKYYAAKVVAERRARHPQNSGLHLDHQWPGQATKSPPGEFPFPRVNPGKILERLAHFLVRK